MQPKELSLLHMTRAMTLMPKLAEDPEATQLALVATYLAPASVLLKVRRDPDSQAFEPFLDQAGEMSAMEAGEVLSDFLLKLDAYNGVLNASLGSLIERLEKGTQTPGSSSSSS